MSAIRFKDVTVSQWIIGVNTLAFALSALLAGVLWSFPAELLVMLGANYGPFTIDGEWWRLITSVFLHAGAIHFLFNSAVLYQIGGILEQLIPRRLFIAVYILSGIGASLVSLRFNFGVVSIGASGAIFGLFGFFAALLTTRLFAKPFRVQFLKSIGFFIGINLVIGTMGPIDNAAHIGGLMTGFLLGLLAIPFVTKILRDRVKKSQPIDQDYQ